VSARRVTGPELMRPREVCDAFRIDPKTVARWRKQGKLSYVLTPGGEHRYDAAQVRALLAGSRVSRQVPGGGPS
jgi:predicted site-specific integrase-resolvase